MTKDKPDTPPLVCHACGGSGIEYHPFGPFMTSVQKRWRQYVQDHVEARHERFRTLDREIAQLVIPRGKEMERGDLTLHDLLLGAVIEAQKAAGAFEKGRIADALRSLRKVASSTVYAMESVEVAAKRIEGDPEL